MVVVGKVVLEVWVAVVVGALTLGPEASAAVATNNAPAATLRLNRLRQCVRGADEC